MVMMKKVFLLAAALTLALPAFADTPKPIVKATKAPASKKSAPKWGRNGVEVHGFNHPVTAPVDNTSTGQVVGKRKHPLKPPK
jgi:hypothetical protein